MSKSLRHPLTRNGRVGIAPVDIQTLHEGHVVLLSHMAMACEVGIVAIGSVGKHGTDGHPFTFEQRKEMVQAVFGDRFKFLPLNDIDASADNGEWIGYVLKKAAGAGLPEPTDCFVGSQVDGKRWYAPHFADLSHDGDLRGLSYVYTRDGEDAVRKLHVIDRERLELPSGRDIRALIEARDLDWRAHVPPVLHAYVEQNYPPHLRIAVRGPILPPHHDYPVGTRFILDGSKEVLELKDDGQWRAQRTRDEKADHARTARANAPGGVGHVKMLSEEETQQLLGK